MSQTIAELNQIIAELNQTILELKEQLNKNSKNSSKPPSSDGLKKPAVNKNKSLRESSGKKQGAQEGHDGVSKVCIKETRHEVDTVVTVDVTAHNLIEVCKCPLHGGTLCRIIPVNPLSELILTVRLFQSTSEVFLCRYLLQYAHHYERWHMSAHHQSHRIIQPIFRPLHCRRLIRFPPADRTIRNWKITNRVTSNIVLCPNTPISNGKKGETALLQSGLSSNDIILLQS